MKEKIPVCILGATGMVGQKFIELLQDHPLFEIVAVAASEKSVGQAYAKACQWRLQSNLNPNIANLQVVEAKPDLPCKLVFSALDSSCAHDIELAFAKKGYLVVSNAKNHRMSPNVPLMIPEVNGSHIELIKKQSFPDGGAIITNPNCSVVGICLALKPIFDAFGLKAMHIVTMQAISGAGFPGVASLDILDNLIPYIADEEDKVETEPLKIFGSLAESGVLPASLSISATCNRVPVSDGHTSCISFSLKKKATKEGLIAAWQGFKAQDQTNPIFYTDHPFYPQPKLHRDVVKGMGVTVGQLRPCQTHGWKCTIVSHNTVRGAAGGAILNAEYLLKKGYI